MDRVRIEIEPQTICRCGKILPMNERERREYDDFVREIEKRRLQHAKPSGDEAVEGRE
jgi:hypothetical protein